jgi:hypothetical protein
VQKVELSVDFTNPGAEINVIRFYWISFCVSRLIRQFGDRNTHSDTGKNPETSSHFDLAQPPSRRHQALESPKILSELRVERESE